MKEYPSVPIPAVVKYLLIPRATWLWAKYRFGTWLLKKRNPIMPIVQHPDPVLSRVAEKVDFEKESYAERSKLVRQMGGALSAVSWGGKLGLAAPQIGVSKRVIIVQGAVLFNPEWTPTQAPPNASLEACYSVPGNMFKVMRVPYGWVESQDIHGNWRTFKVTGLEAIIFQHELDHLNGKCVADVGEEVTQ